MKVESLKVADLSADPANVRAHDERNIEAIVGSLRRFGQQSPIVVDKSNVVRAGNARLEAAKRLGWETIEAYVSDLTGSEMTAFAVADNRTAELAEWDDAALAAVLEGLQFEDEALLEVAGFGEDELAKLLKDVELPDDEPEGSTEEIDEDEFNLDCQCPKCGFEFNAKT